ncbi:MAG: NAD-dependent epimerase/dehydratase family protein [Spirochaetales bacterium]|nr:NAD-dependent epimerase/dehydratase family protein [Spirochaetales bacterium]
MVVFDQTINTERFADLGDKLIGVQGNLVNSSEVLNVVKDNRIQSIVHLGAMLSTPSDANPWAAYRVNADGTMNILEAARLFDVQKVVFTSSNAVYSGVTGAIDDTTLTKPGSLYGITKLFGEHLGLFYKRRFDLDFRALRFCVVIGLGAKTKHMSQYMAWMIEHALEGKPFKVWVSEGTNNPWIYHKDAVRALQEIHDAPGESMKSRVYNLSGTSSTAIQFVEKVRAHISGADIGFDPDPEAVALLGKGIESIDETAAREEWNWKTRFGIDEMLEDLKKIFES